jgi:hypothetical protein
MELVNCVIDLIYCCYYYYYLTSVPAVVPSDGTKSPMTTPVKTAEVGALTAADMSPAPRFPTNYGSEHL